jgi:hypothetical protein
MQHNQIDYGRSILAVHLLWRASIASPLAFPMAKILAGKNLVQKKIEKPKKKKKSTREKKGVNR